MLSCNRALPNHLISSKPMVRICMCCRSIWFPIFSVAQSDGSVDEESSSSWGTKLDMETYNGLVLLSTDKYKDMFGGM